ncbi:MAG TPA: hypothetical protein VFD32_06600 [Dehalococcoidia bacterium]|nr:hypothetical protein [Dehalococcoidia bacterium]
MSYILRPQRWRRQPTYDVGLDPLWGRNALMVLNGISRRDLVSGVALGADAGGNYGYTPLGRGYAYNGAFGTGDGLPITSPTLGPNITFLSVMLISSAVAWAGPMYDRGGVNGITLGDDGLSYRYVWDGTEWAYNTGLTFQVGKVSACGHSISAASVVTAVDGKTDIRTGLTNGATASAFNTHLWIGADPQGSRVLNGVVLLNAIILETWSEPQLREWTLNPWQLFRPQQRRVYSVPAGGTQSFSYTASGGLTFGGASDINRNRVLAAAGGIVFGGSAVKTAVRNVVAAGGIVFGGAATVAFHSAVRIVQAAGGIVFGGAATVSYVGQRVIDWLTRARRRGRR